MNIGIKDDWAQNTAYAPHQVHVTLKMLHNLSHNCFYYDDIKRSLK